MVAETILLNSYITKDITTSSIMNKEIYQDSIQDNTTYALSTLNRESRFYSIIFSE